MTGYSESYGYQFDRDMTQISMVVEASGAIASTPEIYSGTITVGAEEQDNPNSAITLGDVIGDGKINSLDVTLLRRHIVGTTALTGNFLTAADVNRDGKINSLDVTLLRRFIVGTITSF